MHYLDVLVVDGYSKRCFVMITDQPTYDCHDFCFFFFFNDTAPPEIYTLSLHDGSSDLTPASEPDHRTRAARPSPPVGRLFRRLRSEEHTSELQSPCNIVCRLLLETK